MSFGSVVKQLRLQHDMTQERLAELLSISPQAVSRWEQNAGMPDISLLPALANLFDVTTDTLLEVDVRQKEARIEEKRTEARAFSKRGHWREAIAVLRSALKTYPRAYSLSHELASALLSSPQEIDYTEEEYKRIYEEAAALEETVIKESGDTELINDAIATLCMLCGFLSTPERAEPYLNTLPSVWHAKESLATHLYRGDQWLKTQRELIRTLLDLLALHIDSVWGSGAWGTEEWRRDKIALRRKKLALIDLMIEDGNYGFFRQTYGWTELELAEQHAILGENEEAFRYLADAAKHAVLHDTAYRPEDTYTCLLFRGMEFGEVWHNIKENDAAHVLNALREPCFDGLRNDARFREIQEEMERYASER